MRLRDRGEVEVDRRSSERLASTGTCGKRHDPHCDGFRPSRQSRATMILAPGQEALPRLGVSALGVVGVCGGHVLGHALEQVSRQRALRRTLNERRGLEQSERR